MVVLMQPLPFMYLFPLLHALPAAHAAYNLLLAAKSVNVETTGCRYRAGACCILPVHIKCVVS